MRFGKIEPSVPHAQPLDAGAAKLPDRVTLAVNGLLNPSPHNVARSAEHLANTFAIPTSQVWYFRMKEDPSVIDLARIDVSLLMFGAQLEGFGLKEDIGYFLSNGCSVDIHCHDWGAYTTREAVRQLTFEQRKTLSITSYGGGLLIPKNMASSVTNIVNLADQAMSMSGAYRWVKQVCDHSANAGDILFSDRRIWLEMTTHNHILPTIKAQRWTEDDDWTGHQFTSYIDHTALPLGPAHSRFEEVYCAGILTWMASVLPATSRDRDRGAKGGA